MAPSPTPTKAAPPQEPGKALAEGIKLFRRGDYDSAAMALHAAKQGADRLSTTDRTSLDDYLFKTDRAIRVRTQGVLELKQAEASYRAGKYDTATELLKRVNSNGYLAHPDRQRAESLAEALRAKQRSSGRGLFSRFFGREDTPAEPNDQTTEEVGAPSQYVDMRQSPIQGPGALTRTSAKVPPPPYATGEEVSGPEMAPEMTRADAKRLLAEGRQFLESGQVQQAERWAQAANQYRGKWLFLGDSPEKLLRDVEAAKSQLPPETFEPKGQPESLLGSGDAKGQQDARLHQKMGYRLAGDNQANNAPLPTSRRPISQPAPSVHAAANHADDNVNMMADRARTRGTPSAPIQNPMTGHRIPTTESSQVAMMPKGQAPNVAPATRLQPPGRPAPGANLPEPSMTAAAQANGQAATKHPEAQRAQAMLTEARKLLAAGRSRDAMILCQRVRAMNVEYTLLDDTPDKVMAAVRQSELARAARTEPASETAKPTRSLLSVLKQAQGEPTPKESGEEIIPAPPREIALASGEKPASYASAQDLDHAVKPAIAEVAKTAGRESYDAQIRRVEHHEHGPAFSPKEALAIPEPKLENNSGAVWQAKQPENPSPAKVEAVKLVASARAALNRGDYAAAVAMAKRADSLQVPWYPDEDSPEMLHSALQAIKAGNQERRDTALQDEKLRNARQLTAAARKMFDNGFYQEAAKLAEQAIALKAPFGLDEERPEQLLVEIVVRSQEAPAKPAIEVAKIEETPADALVAQAEQQLRMGHHEKADASLRQAAEITPEVPELQQIAVPDDIEMIPEVSGQSLFDKASELLAKQNYAEARRAATALKTGPYSMEAEADKLLETIGHAEEAGSFLVSGMNAMKRHDFAQAQAYFKEAAVRSEHLSDIERQRIQELLPLAEEQARLLSASPPVVPGQLPSQVMVAAANDSRPGRARASDVSNAFVNQAEPDPNAPPAPAPGNEPADPRGATRDLTEDQIELARERDKIEFQRLRRVVISALDQANQEVRRDPAAAIRLLEGALATVQDSFLDRDETVPLQRQLMERMRQYRIDQKQFEITQLERDRSQATVDARRRQDLAEIKKQQSIKELSNRFNALMDAGKYLDAEMVAYQITEIDPDEPFGHAALWKARLASHYNQANELEVRKQEGWWRALQSVEDSSVPFDDREPLIYPDAKTWEDLTNRRQKYKSVDLSEKSEATLEIERALARPITFDFSETPFQDVLDFIKDYTAVNVVPDLVALEEVGVDLDLPITLSLNSVTLRSALRLLLRPLELTYLVEDEVLKITTAQASLDTPVTRVYPVGDLVIPIQNFAQGGGVGGLGGGGGLGGVGGGGGGIGGGGGGFGGGGGGFGGGGGGFGGGGGGFGGGGGGGGFGGGQGGQGGDISEDVIELIQSTVEPSSWEEEGGAGRIEYFQPNLSFVITQTQEVHEKVADLFTQLRRLQDLQVTVEVRFISVSESFFERIGVDFDVSVDNNQDRYIQNTFAGQNSPPGTSLTDPFLGTNTGNHLRGVTIGRDPTGGPTSDFNIPITQSSFAASQIGRLGDLATTAGGGTNFGIAFLNDIDVYLLLEAVQGDDRTNTMTAPKVTLFNGQFATVVVATAIPFVTDATPVVSQGAVTFDPTITTISSGTTLSIQAIVSADRRYVRLTVIPNIQNVQAIDQVRTVQVSGVAGGAGAIGGGAVNQQAAQVPIELPQVEVNQVLTTVAVPDGGTILLGGLKAHTEQRREFGTPVLSKVPYINRLFKNATSGRFSRSLMLMVSPRIIIFAEEEEKLGAQTSFGL